MLLQRINFLWILTRSFETSEASGVVQPVALAEHLRLILESDSETEAFYRAAQDLARAEVPHDVFLLPRMGLLTALQKPGGGVRGIVCGDFVRRLVAMHGARDPVSRIWTVAALST